MDNITDFLLEYINKNTKPCQIGRPSKMKDFCEALLSIEYGLTEKEREDLQRELNSVNRWLKGSW